MKFVSVSEAADRLGVSSRRVRQRIENGSLPAERVGNRWAIDASQLAVSLARVSRPLSPRMAWALLHLLASDEPHVSASEKVRLRSYIRRLADQQDPAALLRAWLSRRAARVLYRAADADLNDIYADSRLLLSGVSAPDSGIVAPGVLEAYVDEGAQPSLVADFFLVPADVRPGNVILHVVEDRPPVASWPLIAADLAEHAGPRESARVAELVRTRVLS